MLLLLYVYAVKLIYIQTRIISGLLLSLLMLVTYIFWVYFNPTTLKSESGTSMKIIAAQENKNYGYLLCNVCFGSFKYQLLVLKTSKLIY